MAIIEAQLLYTMKLTTPELRIVLKALGGRARTKEDNDAAAALGDVMTRMRADTLRAMSKTAADLDKALGDGA